MITPWGNADQQTKLDDGLYWVGTPSHGGLGVTTGYADKHLSSAAKNAGLRLGLMIWYEEDCKWAVAAYELPQFWPWFFQYMQNCDTEAKQRQYLLDTLRHWEIDYCIAAGLADKPEFPDGEFDNGKHWTRDKHD